MAKTYSETFVAEVTSVRTLTPLELERHLARLPGVTAVSVTNPLADDPVAAADLADPIPLVPFAQNED
jgi:hypothetical protein